MVSTSQNNNNSPQLNPPADEQEPTGTAGTSTIRQENSENENENGASALEQLWNQNALFLRSILDALSFEVAPPADDTEIPPVPLTASDQIIVSSSEPSNRRNQQQQQQQQQEEEEGEEVQSEEVLQAPSGSGSRNSSTCYPGGNVMRKPSPQPMQDISSYTCATDQTSPMDPSFRTVFSDSVDEDEENILFDNRRRRKDVSEEQHPEDTTNNDNHKKCCPLWTRLTEDGLHKWIRGTVVKVGTYAARYPKTHVAFISLLSLLLAVVGLLTNFHIKFDHQDLFTPMNSLPARNGHWVEQESGFEHIVQMLMIVHSDGENVLNTQAVRRTFEALDALRGVEGYDEVCEPSNYIDPMTGKHTCWVWSVTEFWDHNITHFDENDHTEMDLVHVLSQSTFPNGIPVFHEMMMGGYQRTNESLFSGGEDIMYDDKLFEPEATTTNNTTTEYISYIPSYMVGVGFPDLGADTEVFQERALSVLQDLQMEWQQQDETENPFNVKLEFFCQYAYELEYERALAGDMPLIPIIFVVMLGFTMIVFHKYGTHQNDNYYEDSSCEDPDQRRKQVFQSRASLGVASVATIGCSLMSGFGILFIFGVPFTNITLMAPFIILGVGLDDTFIITGAYFRHLRKYHAECDAKAAASAARGGDTIAFMYGQQLDTIPQNAPVDEPTSSSPVEAMLSNDHNEEHDRIVQRVHDTLQEVGLSISLTTITTTLAFVLGCISTIPGIRWLCIYASVTIFFDFVYQVTFFVALLSLDERRVSRALRDSHYNNSDNRKSWWQWCCCCCCCLGSSNQSESSHQAEKAKRQQQQHDEEEEFFMDRIMKWYATKLLRPSVRIIVVVIFLVFFGLNVWSTTQLTQEFNVEDYVPEDSYTRPFFHALREYSTLVVPMAVYFRNVNQSDPVIQQQMMDFIDDVSALPQIGQPPEFCWVRDMHALLSSGSNATAQAGSFHDMSNEQHEQMAFMASALENGDLTFNEKVEIALSIPTLRDIYGEDILQDPETLEITASRCYIFIRHLDLADINEQIDMLYDQREITMEQPINQGKADLPFFTFDNLYYYWELYTVAVDELIVTTIMGVIAVCVVGFIMIPHWTAVAFVGPMIIMLYFNMLGTLQACGMHINAVTYVTVVISIGLLVDFLMHILLRYYETTGTTREAKVRETLETIGSSMLLGGLTTWLGVVPMAFSSTKIFMTLFVAFLAMVTWGLLVGLVFLPVVLSYCGPLICTSTDGNVKCAEARTNFDKSSLGKKCSRSSPLNSPQSDTSSDGAGSQGLLNTSCDTASTTISTTESKDGALSTTSICNARALGSICTGGFSKEDAKS